MYTCLFLFLYCNSPIEYVLSHKSHLNIYCLPQLEGKKIFGRDDYRFLRFSVLTLAELAHKFFNISVSSAKKINGKLPGRVGLAELVLAELTVNRLIHLVNLEP